MNLTPEQIEANQAAVKASGDRTLQQYSNWMQTNAASHMMRAARQSGITHLLRQRQHTLDQLCEELSLNVQTTQLLLAGLVAIGFVEQYEDDFTLARAGHLLCQHDEDLGDRLWEQLVPRLKQTETDPSVVDRNVTQNHFAATQWIHTAAAIQTAEILDIGGESSASGIRILDLGCGAAVWSCAMAHRDADATVVAVDSQNRLTAARSTAESIEMGDRFKTIESDPLNVTVGENQFDLVVLAQQMSLYSDADASTLLAKAVVATKPGGRVVAPDLYIGPGRAGLTESTGRLAVHLGTQEGAVRDLRTAQQMFQAAGLNDIQFTYLAASHEGLGMIVATA